MQVSEQITSCRICGSENIREVLNLGDQPPANSLRDDRNEALPIVPLKLVFCGDCATVQLSHTVDPAYLFSHYVWVTGTSSTAVEYSKTFCQRVMSHVGREGQSNPFVVEIASNDGTFLRRFKEEGCDVLGVDPAQNIAEIAQKSGVPTRADFFNRGVAEDIRNEMGEASAVIARNVIPHVKEVHSIIDGISHLIGDKGTGIIEFHYARKILDELHYDSVYHEHLFYFSLKTMGVLLSKYGLHIHDVDESPISGGSLVIYFSRAQKEKTSALLEVEAYEQKSGMNTLSVWQAFADKCQDHAKTLTQMVSDAKKEGKVVGYGASARSSTLLNFCGISDQDLEYIIDKNELKHGKITPGSNIYIVPFSDNKADFEDISAIVMLAWNFEKEIEKELRDVGYEGPIIMPLPNSPRII